VGRLTLGVVDHGPALSRLDGERLGVAVSRLGHAVHPGTVATDCSPDGAGLGVKVVKDRARLADTEIWES
jgi:hypothetical protein